MAPKKTNSSAGINKKAASAGTEKKETGEHVVAAHDEALTDIEQDPDFSMHSPNDDLDEGETARPGEDKTDLV